MHMNEWTPLGQPGFSKFALRTWRTRLVLLLICCLFVVSAPAGANGKKHIVTISDFSFKPRKLVVAIGDRVTWINKGNMSHSATRKGFNWDSTNISPDQSWTLVIDETSSGKYFCLFHPLMKGEIRVSPGTS